MKMNRKIQSPLIFILVLILSLKISVVKSQATNPSKPADDDNNNLYANTKFSPTVAITVIILVLALFFMGFFSIYIRQCSDVDTGGAGGNNSVRRNALGLAQRGGDRGRVGLEPSVIETFPMFSYSEVRDHKIGKGALECAVCLNEFEDDETLRLIPKCDHVFHPECIDAWLENHITCPVCRTNLTPQAGDEPYRLPEINQENNNDVAIQVDVEEDKIEIKPEVNRVWSFKYSNRPPRTESFKGGGGRNMFGLGKFRSHSTGHLIQPCENVDRFTLRLPEEVRKEMMNRALLNRAKSVAAVSLPREGSSTTRRWFRTGSSVGSMKGSSSLPKINEPDRGSKSGRWQFFTRKVSMKSTKVVAGDGEASTSTIEPTKSFKMKEPKNIDEKSLLRSEPVQPPWL